MQFVLKQRVQCLKLYITLVVSFAYYPCNEHKTDVGCPKYESDTSIVRYVMYKANTTNKKLGARGQYYWSYFSL